MAKTILIVYSSNCKQGSVHGNEIFEVEKYPLTASELGLIVERIKDKYKDKYNFETVTILNIIPLKN